jgi:oxygen-independent coproporphyrinogen-3 oxidase
MNSTQIEFDPELVRRFDRPGPRYTSYPTADRFGATFSEASYRTWAARRWIGGIQRPLALYVHLPFCHDICFYCACNKIVTRDAVKAAKYLDYLCREIEMQAALFRDDPRVVQMHWGGGTPTYYDAGQMARLYQHLARNFEFAADGEYSIEVDPRTVDADTMNSLRKMGFNRVSFGVQDFDPGVQGAIHRVQSEEQTRAAIDGARRAGFASINVDLIYGLPKQTLASLETTLRRVIETRPGRIALYNYAHLPHLVKSQRRISEGDMPPPDIKLKLLEQAIRLLASAGYVHIGMDHFALPDDALAVAQRQGRLHRNFQGYSTGAEADLVGLGVSAIGAIGPSYCQNVRGLDEYYECLDRGALPIMRGIELGADDLVRRAVIEGLMCHFEVSKEAIEAAYLVDFDHYFAAELDDLREFEEQGLLELEKGWISVTARGRFLIRSICMVFDRYLRTSAPQGRYSRVI